MAKNTSISLGDHFTQFIGEKISQGRYGSASEIVRAGLRMLEEHEDKVEALRSALVEGKKSGPLKKFEAKKFLATVKKRKKNG